MIAEKEEPSLITNEEAFLHDVEMATLRRLTEIGFAEQTELREFYEQFRSQPDYGKSDILFHLLLSQRRDPSESNAIARKLMISEERLIRCDFIDEGCEASLVSRDLMPHVRLCGQMGIKVLLAGSMHLLIAGFNPIGICRLKERLGKIPLSSRVLPYVSAVWVSVETYQSLVHAPLFQNGSGSRV